LVLKCFFLLFITIWAAEDCDSHFVTHHELQLIMDAKRSLSKFVQPLNQMLKENHLDCPLRIAAFLSLVRYETDGLQLFSDEDGSGAFHMLPSDIRVACQNLPDFKAAFSLRYTNCTEDNPCNCGTADEMGEVLDDPKFAFQTAAWLFSTGAELLRGSQCKNLIDAADQGLGTFDGDIKTGFHHITRCIHGYDNTEGLDSRIQFYNDALAIVQSWKEKDNVKDKIKDNIKDKIKDNAEGDENQDITSQSFELTFWQLIAIGAGFLVIFIVLIILVIVILVKKNRSERV